MPEPQGFQGSNLKQLWLKKHAEYFNTPEEDRAKLGMTFPIPSEYNVNPRDPQIRKFIVSSFGGDESRLEAWQEASEIHEMIKNMENATQSGAESGAVGGMNQLAKRLAELGFPAQKK